MTNLRKKKRKQTLFEFNFKLLKELEPKKETNSVPSNNEKKN